MATINEVTEGARGCGFRKPGGFYLRTDDVDAYNCGRLPIPLRICNCCGQGIKQTRGYNWISGSLINSVPCKTGNCETCPFDKLVGDQEKLMLVWIGKKFYNTVKSFMDEAGFMGISRRLPALPRGFVVGETKIALAHPDAVLEQDDNGDPIATPGIFYLFTPTRMEYVVREDDSEDKLDRLEAKGITLVRVFKKINQDQL